MSVRTNSKTRRPSLQVTITKPKNSQKIKPTARHISSISQCNGIPLPEDLKNKDINLISESKFDKEAKNIKSTTDALSKEIQIKLEEYKKSNKAHLDKKQIIDDEVNNCKKEFNIMKYSIEEVLVEAHNTKKTLTSMRELIDSESLNELEGSSII